MPGSVVSVLFRKKSAELSRGYYTRGAKVWPPNRSRFNPKPGDAACEVGMGIVQALLAVLSGHVDQFTWREQGLVGTAHLFSTSSGRDYTFTWDEGDPELAMFGGFTVGPTYQLAILHLILCYLDQYHGGGERSGELMECWFKLVDAMRRFSPQIEGRGWSVEDVGAACWNAGVRALLERTADAAWFAMRYRLPNVGVGFAREQDLYGGQVLDLPFVSAEGTLEGVALFSRPRPARVRFAATKQARPEMELKLGQGQLQGLVAAREERIVGAMPVWHFPEPGE